MGKGVVVSLDKLESELNVSDGERTTEFDEVFDETQNDINYDEIDTVDEFETVQMDDDSDSDDETEYDEIDNYEEVASDTDEVDEESGEDNDDLLDDVDDYESVNTFDDEDDLISKYTATEDDEYSRIEDHVGQIPEVCEEIDDDVEEDVEVNDDVEEVTAEEVANEFEKAVTQRLDESMKKERDSFKKVEEAEQTEFEDVKEECEEKDDETPTILEAFDEKRDFYRSDWLIYLSKVFDYITEDKRNLISDERYKNVNIDVSGSKKSQDELRYIYRKYLRQNLEIAVNDKDNDNLTEDFDELKRIVQKATSVELGMYAYKENNYESNDDEDEIVDKDIETYFNNMEKLRKNVHEGLNEQYKEMLEHDKEEADFVNRNRSILENEINPKIVMSILNDDTSSTVFDEPRAFEEEFKESPFYYVLKRVMLRERLVDVPRTPIRMSIRIDQITNFFTVVDFSTGVRVICIDTDDPDQIGCNPFVINKNVPFSYPKEIMGRIENVKLRMLYKDTCEERPVSIIRRLQKLVAHDYIEEKYKVKLFENFVVGYTTDFETVDMFESGDGKGSKGNSPYVVGRAHTNRIGIMVIASKSNAKPIRKDKAEGFELNEYDFTKNYNIVCVASCRYITDERVLNRNDLSDDAKIVRYTITQYDEINSCVITDGFTACLKAIIMEHESKFGPQTKFSIEYELDRGAIVPTTISDIIDYDNLMVLSKVKNNNPFGLQTTKVLSKNNRIKDIPFDRGRADERYFTSARTLSSIFPPNILTNYNLFKPNKEGINEFMAGRGYMDCYEPGPITFDINPLRCTSLMCEPGVDKMFKIDVNALKSFENQEFNRLRMAQARFETEEKSKNGDISSLLLTAFDFLDTVTGLKNGK